VIFEVKVATEVATFLGQVATYSFLNIDLGFSAEKAKKIGARRWDRKELQPEGGSDPPWRS